MPIREKWPSPEKAQAVVEALRNPREAPPSSGPRLAGVRLGVHSLVALRLGVPPRGFHHPTA